MRFFYLLGIEIILYLSCIFNLIVNSVPSPFKKILLKLFLKKFYMNTLVDQNLFFRNPLNISIGKNVNINYGCHFFSGFGDIKKGSIVVEENVTFSPKVNVYAISQNPHSVNFDNIYKKVVIKKNAWICANVTILPGVVIGENSVIAANSLVNRNTNDNEIWGGIPAKFIGKRKND